MNKYTPFLKFKGSEIGALKLLKKTELASITPFFDLATKKDITDHDIENTITKGLRKYELNFQGCPRFYIDDFDLDDSHRINGDIVYNFFIDTFQSINFIPVVGLDRTPDRISSLHDPLIGSDTFALRLTKEDFKSYVLSEDDIADIMNEFYVGDSKPYSKVHLIIDCRVCVEENEVELSNLIAKFIYDICQDYNFEKIILTGSSISVNYIDNVASGQRNTIDRIECAIYNAVTSMLEIKNIELGDYTVITPDYSDIDIPPAALRKVMTPKVVYSYGTYQHFLRGNAIESHPDGAGQYDTLCLELVGKTFFRGEQYSGGDAYIVQKSKKIGKDAQPAFMNKHLINAHITYMLKDY